jgi:hypothetical protein
MAMSHHAFPPVRQPGVSYRRQERLGLGFNSLSQEPPGAFPENRSQRVVDGIGLTERDNTAIARHGVSAPSGVQAGSSPASIRRLDHPAITQIPA